MCDFYKVTRKISTLLRIGVLIAMLCSSGVNASESVDLSKMTDAQIRQHASNLPSSKLEKLKNPYKKKWQELDNAYYETHDGTEKEPNYPPEYLDISAKYERFNDCQGGIVHHVGLSSNAKSLHPLGDEELYKSFSNSLNISYPFTAEDALDNLGRISQLAIDMAIKNKGRGQETVNRFFKRCTNMTLKIYIDGYLSVDNNDKY